MNYDKRNPVFSFRLGESRHGKLTRIANQNKMPTADYLRKIVDDYLNGDLIPKAKDDLYLEMQKLKVEKMKSQLQLLIEEIRYYKIRNDFAENFGEPMSNSARRLIKPQIIKENNQSPYDESNNRFMCVDCGVCFEFNSIETFLAQMREYKNHIIAKHNRELNAIESDVLGRVRFNEDQIK